MPKDRFLLLKKKLKKNLPGDSICCNSCYNTKIFQKKRRLWSCKKKKRDNPE
jgi:hypothetical protein